MVLGVTGCVSVVAEKIRRSPLVCLNGRVVGGIGRVRPCGGLRKLP